MPNWTSVEEGLPSADEWVFVLCEDDWIGKAFCDDWRGTRRVWRDAVEREEIYGVLYWCALGDPPPGIEWGKP